MASTGVARYPWNGSSSIPTPYAPCCNCGYDIYVGLVHHCRSTRPDPRGWCTCSTGHLGVHQAWCWLARRSG